MKTKSVLTTLKESAKKEHAIPQKQRTFKVKQGRFGLFREWLSYDYAAIGKKLFGRTEYALPGVYRNKPCPCGSGYKYKRCCYPAWPHDAPERRPMNKGVA